MTGEVVAREAGLPWTSTLVVERFRQSDILDAIHAGAVPRSLTVGEHVALADGRLTFDDACWRASQRIERADLVKAGLDPFGPLVEAVGNLETYTGLNNMLRLLIGTTVGAGGTNYAFGTARLLVGTGGGSVPTAAVTDTDLTASTGASNRYCQACDSSYPSVPNAGNNSASAVATAVATIASGNGNFAWNEWGMDSGGSSGTGAASGLFNHRGVALITKSSAAAAALTATFTQS